MNPFAPVCIPTLCRYEHFRRCVESLAACTHAGKTDLFIALDYPSCEPHWSGYRNIESYLPHIDGFASVVIIKRETNYGAYKNFYETLKEIFSKHDSLIFTEDDNEFSPNFLDYINKGLNKFDRDERVFAVCGYNYPIEMPQGFRPNYYLASEYSAWGCGMWKDKFTMYYRDMQYDAVTAKLRNPLLAVSIARSLPGFLHVVKTGNVVCDVVATANLKIKNMYCVFPSVTKVKNHGHDGSGVNGGIIKGKNIYLSQELDTDDVFTFSEPPNPSALRLIKKSLKRYFYRSLRLKILTWRRYLLFKITGHVYD
jgi:hypothetical protein